MKPVSTAIAATVQLDLVGMRVAAEIVVGLEQRHLVLARQQPRAASPEMPEPTTAMRTQRRAFASTCAGTGFRPCTRPSAASSRSP